MQAADTVLSLYSEARFLSEESRLMMHAMKDQYNGDILFPLPQVDKMEAPAIANLIHTGIEQNAMRVASVRSMVTFDQYGNTDIAAKRAADRRRAVYGWRDMNNWNLLQRRRARHLITYGMTVVSISPVSDDQKDMRHIPFWRVRNPLSTYLSPMTNPDNMSPDWAIFADKHTVPWFEAKYPDKMGALFGGGRVQPTDRYEILEYVDEWETALVAVGSDRMTQDRLGHQVPSGIKSVTLIDRIPNRTMMVPVVAAGRITLDRPMGQFDQTLGAFRREATLDALNTISITRNIFAEQWAVSSSNSPSSPRVIKRANAKKGEIGVIDKGTLMTVRPPMNQDILQAMDRYERAVSIGGGVPAGFKGESATNVRSAVQGNDVTEAMVDMWLMESQELLAASEQEEVRIAINTAKDYYGNRKTSFYFGKDGKIPHNDYTPNELFENDLCHVKYPMPGLDLNQQTTAFGQMKGMGEIDLQTIRELDGRIDDPDLVAERVDVEAWTQAWFTGIEQQAAQGQLDTELMARVFDERLQGESMLRAYIRVSKDIKAEQAAAAQQQQQNPGAITADQQPGVASGPAAEQAAPAAPAAQPSLEDLLGQLGGGSGGPAGATPAPPGGGPGTTQPAGGPGSVPYIAPAPAPAGV